MARPDRMLPEPTRMNPWLDADRRVSPEPLNVAPELIGRPLATPGRRGLAMGVDLTVIGLLTGVSGLWLLAGLALVVLQLRSRRGAGGGGGPAAAGGDGLAGRRRAIVGWLGAFLVAALALNEAHTQWTDWRHPEAKAAVEADEAREAALEAAQEAVRDAAPETAKLIAIAQIKAREQARRSVAAPTASAPATLSAEARIEQLEAQLAEARKPRTLRWRDQLRGLLDDIGAGLGWGVVYFSLLPAWWGGQTLGKRLLRLQVVELTGKPMTVMRSLKRYGGYAAGLATGGVGLLQVLWDPNRQGLQDKAAHTVVLDLRTGPPPAQVSPT